jgi:hypothetical protein
MIMTSTREQIETVEGDHVAARSSQRSSKSDSPSVKAHSLLKPVFSRVIRSGQTAARRFVILLMVAIVLAGTGPRRLLARQVTQETPAFSESSQQSREQLRQLVAPIALYPDGLVAQILAACTYPAQIVEAHRWLLGHSDWTAEELAKEVDNQPWDASVKALTQFPEVLSNLDKNLSWTSALGEAYFNQQQDVLDAVQDLRQRAQAAGNLQSSAQETVTSQDQTIAIEPADPEVIYVPAYNPWVVYGGPIPVYPGFIFGDLWDDSPFISFGIGVPIGFFGGFGWGWRRWDCDWKRRVVVHNHHSYVSHSSTFFHHSSGGRGSGRFGQDHEIGHPNGFKGADHNSNPGRGAGVPGGSFKPDPRAARGFGNPVPDKGARSGAFGGFGEGGIQHGFGSRGRSSAGGGSGLGGFGGGGGRGGGGGARHR